MLFRSIFWAAATFEIVLMSEVAAAQKIQINDINPLGYPIFDEAILGGSTPGDLIIVSAPTGQGKCLGLGTPIIMYDGSIKKVEDIIVGDFIMGDDSTPREVSSLARGREEMYDIIPVKGDKYTVNKSHILSLKTTKAGADSRTPILFRDKGNTIDISVQDYLLKSKTFKHITKGYRVGVDFKKNKTLLDPYFMGVWLGDGTSVSAQITSKDIEIVEYLKGYSASLGMKLTPQDSNGTRCPTYLITRGRGSKKNFVLDALRKHNLISNKHIPNEYKINSRSDRLKILAGLIDTDGYLSYCGYEITTKHEVLRDDILFLARSLGFSAYWKNKRVCIKSRNFEGNYFRINISGDCSIIPVKIKRKKASIRRQTKSVLVTGIKVEPIGVGDYYGFTIGGNGRFLLGDFTVTHNTTFCQSLTCNFLRDGKKVLWFSYEVLMSYLWQKFEKMGIKPEEFVFAPFKNTTGNVGWIEKKVKEAKQKFGIKMVVIDHLGYLMPKMKQDGISGNYATFLTQIVREIKTLAIQEEIIICLPVHMRKTESPDINDIRDSAGIAQEADLVFVMERLKNTVGSEAAAMEYYSQYTKISLIKNRKTGKSVVGKFHTQSELFVYSEEETRKKEEVPPQDKKKYYHPDHRTEQKVKDRDDHGVPNIMSPNLLNLVSKTIDVALPHLNKDL